MDIETILADVAAAVEPHRGAGKVASYIPALAEVDPRQFGIALVDGQGKCHGAGDCDEPFSIQSIPKLFPFGLALERVGPRPEAHTTDSSTMRIASAVYCV